MLSFFDSLNAPVYAENRGIFYQITMAKFAFPPMAGKFSSCRRWEKGRNEEFLTVYTDWFGK